MTTPLVKSVLLKFNITPELEINNEVLPHIPRCQTYKRNDYRWWRSSSS